MDKNQWRIWYSSEYRQLSELLYKKHIPDILTDI